MFEQIWVAMHKKHSWHMWGISTKEGKIFTRLIAGIKMLTSEERLSKLGLCCLEVRIIRFFNQNVWFFKAVKMFLLVMESWTRSAFSSSGLHLRREWGEIPFEGCKVMQFSTMNLWMVLRQWVGLYCLITLAPSPIPWLYKSFAAPLVQVSLSLISCKVKKNPSVQSDNSWQRPLNCVCFGAEV